MHLMETSESIRRSCIWLLVFAALCRVGVQSAFTCQGTSYRDAVNRCPDGGSQQLSAGGNVTIKVLYAVNLLNKDSSGPSAMVSDPYVRFKVGDVSVRTSTVRNSLNPVWEEYVSLGFLGSATEITVEMWDADSGLEFADDLIARSTVRVPFCSTFATNSTSVVCDDPFNCVAYDSLWRMPTRKTCNESGFINFFPQRHSCASGKGTCVYFEFHIVPFEMKVEVTYPKALSRTPQLSVLGQVSASWTSTFGFPFIGSSLSLDPFAAQTANVRGALMFRSSNADKSFGAYNAIKYYASVNFAATLYICRYESDNDKGVPAWITSEYNSRYVNINKLLIRNSGDNFFGCYHREISGTRKNEWGGVESGAVALRTNTLAGHDTNSVADQNYYAYNYIVLAVPSVSAPREDSLSIVYDMSLFLNFFGAYGLIWCWFFFLVVKFLHKIHFRVDRLSHYLATRVLTGEDCCVLAGLFLNFNQSPCNVEYRSHLYHAKNIILFCLLLPLGLLLSWGMSVAVVVRPRALGVALFFVGTALIFLWYAFRLWEASQWRLSALSVAAFIVSFGSLALFLIVALFVDPAFLHEGYALDLAGLSLIFGALNCVPCILLLFKQDRSMALYLELVVAKINDAVLAARRAGQTGAVLQPSSSTLSTERPATSALSLRPGQELQINRALHNLLGDKYSIHPKLPALKYAGVMSEIRLSYNTAMADDWQAASTRGRGDKAGGEAASHNNEEDDDEEGGLLQRLLTEERRLYGLSLLVLFVYLVIAASTTASASLAFLHICALLLLDVVHLSMSKGDNVWSPGFKALLLILGRMLVCGSTVSLWMLNYAACYLLYSLALIHELIQGVLPALSLRRAGEIVFGGGETVHLIKSLLRTTDLSGGPAFSLGLLSLAYLAVVIIAAFSESGDTTTSTRLLVPTLDVWGDPWPVYVFAIASFLAAGVVGLMMATKRAYDLDAHGLLQGWARETYLFRKDIKLPAILALSVEAAILLSGLLLYALTEAAAVLVGAVYLPAICLCFGVALQRWRRNDYELVPWPRPQKVERPATATLAMATAMGTATGPSYSKDGTTLAAGGSSGPDGGDLEQAFSMIENLFGSQEYSHINNVRGGTATRGGGSPWATVSKPGTAGGGGGVNPALTATTSDLVLGFEDDPPGADNPETEVEARGDAPLRTLKGFALPALRGTASTDPRRSDKEIKMPPLPLKSVLRRKRQNMAVKLQSQVPLVSDLRARESAVSADQFGNKAGDVFDANDPWAKFEMTEEEALLQRKNKKKGTVAKAAAKEARPSLFRRMVKAIQKSPWLRTCYYRCLGWWSYARHVRVSPAAYQPDLEHDLDAGQDLESYLHEAGEGTEAAEGGGEAGGEGRETASPGGRSRPALASTSPDKSRPSSSSAAAGPGLGKHDDDDDLVDVDKLSYSQAFWSGYLTSDEYLGVFAWYGGLFLVMLFGLTLAHTVHPPYLGYIVWIATWLFLLVSVPLYKYFQVYELDTTAWRMLYFAGLVHFLFCVCFFAVELRGDLGLAASLWIFDFFVYFPVFTYILFSAAQWMDAGFRLPAWEKRADGSWTLRDVGHVLRSFPALVVVVILFAWQLYIWINITVGLVFTLCVILCVLVYVYVKDWADNDHFLSPELVSLAKFMTSFTMFISFCVGVFREANPAFALSVFFFTWMGRHALAVGHTLSMRDREDWMYFSPYLFPVYSYDANTQDVRDECDWVKLVCAGAVLAELWACLLVIFLHPMHIGIALACGLGLFAAAVVILCTSYIPRQLAKSQALLEADMVREAAALAVHKYEDRKLPLNLEMQGYEADVPDDVLDAATGPAKTLLDRLKERSCFENCVAVMADQRALKYVRREKSAEEAAALAAEAAEAAAEDKDEYDLTCTQQWGLYLKQKMRELYELLPVHPEAGYQRHAQAPFGWKDLLVEVFFTGRGPFGVLGPEGMWIRLAQQCKENPHLAWLHGRWMEDYDALGNNRTFVQLEENVDYPALLARNLDADRAVDYTFKEETRCAVHFLLSCLVGAEAKLQRETVLFQKFLRENRYRLAANGISPPRDIFSSESYASINIPLVAVWLSTLTPDQQHRFHTLKATFNAEQRDRDVLIQLSDQEAMSQAEALAQQYHQRDEEVMHALNQQLVLFRERRVQLFAESLDGPDRVKFLQRRELWTHDLDCYVDMKDMDLYERFKAACLAERDDMVEHALHQLREVEAAQRDIRLGEYGRSYQFVDSDFPPSDYSLGDGDGASYVLGWRCAPGVVENMQLFDEGTHPDSVCTGVFRDTWLLSALSMLLAAGDFGRGLINERVRSLFVAHPSPSNEDDVSLDTQVGVYCVRLYRNHDWVPVLVDDLLPMRKKEHWTHDNRGLACAHAREGKGLWVSLIEKAMAKYLGSYARLEAGCVHHALTTLTGCEADALPLSSYGRGLAKRAFWAMLLRYKRNGYILGAGTGEAALVDRDVQDMGICFNTAYTIYDVLDVDGHCLIKLRNPPGDHDEWKGDWSDRSALWTRRLKAKCHFQADEHDNTFFMSLDDFVNVFRFLYVCKYYNPRKWLETQWLGFWKKPDESAVEQMDLMNQFLAEQGESVAGGSSTTGEGGGYSSSPGASGSRLGADRDSQERKRAKARLDSAGGLPSRHNPGCVLENNPHYSLRIHRPTDVHLTVTQYNAKGVRSHFTVVPFAVLVVHTAHAEVAKRLTALRREDVVQSTGEPRAVKSQSLYLSGLLPGLYTVLVGAYRAGMEGQFSISVRSNYRSDLVPVWPPAWMLRDDRGDKAGKATKTALLDTLGKSFKGSAAAHQAQRGMLRANNRLRGALKALFGKGDDDGDDGDGDGDGDGDEDEGGDGLEEGGRGRG